MRYYDQIIFIIVIMINNNEPRKHSINCSTILNAAHTINKNIYHKKSEKVK